MKGVNKAVFEVNSCIHGGSASQGIHIADNCKEILSLRIAWCDSLFLICLTLCQELEQSIPDPSKIPERQGPEYIKLGVCLGYVVRG
ncbi:hypothetical protein OLK001_32060 [Synechocystis sp. LKSZ1]